MVNMRTENLKFRKSLHIANTTYLGTLSDDQNK